MNEDDERDRIWWERTWQERSNVLTAVFGPSHPPGAPENHVVAFDLSLAKDFPKLVVPGACAMVFPPRERREAWVYTTLGLTQPTDERESQANLATGRKASGYGAEFAVVTDKPADWPAGFLRFLMGYVKTEAAVGAGDRMPFGFQFLLDNTLSWFVGDPAEMRITPADDTRGMIFWPWLGGQHHFTTSTDSFDLVCATSVTGDELDFARAHSGYHVLLLLQRAGVGQRCVLRRPSTIADPALAALRLEIEAMDESAALAALTTPAAS